MPTVYRRECDHCGTPYKGMGKLFCSSECRGKAQRNRDTYSCKRCHLTFERPKSTAKHDNPAYCSQSCWVEDAKANNLRNRAEHEQRQCETCNVNMDVLASKIKDGGGRFCSQSCMVRWRTKAIAPLTKKRVALKCLWCGDVIERRPSELVNGRSKFCSRECNGAWTARYCQNRVSKAEIAFSKMLSDTGLKFEEQARFGRFVVDFLFPESRLVVEFDGEYWHSLPRVIEKDARKDKAIKDRGYRVIHIKEFLVRDHPDIAIEMVKNAIA